MIVTRQGSWKGGADRIVSRGGYAHTHPHREAEEVGKKNVGMMMGDDDERRRCVIWGGCGGVREGGRRGRVRLDGTWDALAGGGRRGGAL